MTRTPDMKLVAELNAKMRIAHNPKAFEFPMYIHEKIWRNLDQNIKAGEYQGAQMNKGLAQCLEGGTCINIAHCFARFAPPWLQYGSIEAMSADAVTLINLTLINRLKAGTPRHA